MNANRRNTIDHIVATFQAYQPKNDREEFSKKENIIFFESLKSLFNYFKWIIFRASRVDASKLLEVNDFPFPEYDGLMHAKLIEIERKKFPGLIKMPVNILYKFIIKQQHVVVASLGSGAMELERQVIEKLKKDNFNGSATFFAIDLSQSAIDIAKENLKELKVPLVDVAEINDGVIKKAKNFQGTFQVVFCKKDIFYLKNAIVSEKFDAVYYTLFKHHLTGNQKNDLDAMIKKISKNTFEYDGYRSFMLMIPQTIIGWNNPVFLNAEIFSNLRFDSIKNIKNAYRGRGKLTFHKAGYYMLVY